MRQSSLSHPAVLLVVPEGSAGDELALAISRLGWSVDGPFATAGQALAHLEDARPGFAMVGTVLDDGTAVPLVSALRRLGVPFVLLGGFEPATCEVHALVSYGQGWVDAGLDELLPAQTGRGTPARAAAPLPSPPPASPRPRLLPA